MKTIAGAVGIVFLASVALFPVFSLSACAQSANDVPAILQDDAGGAAFVQTAQSEGEFPVSASDAAEIARNSIPGSKVLKVKLLPSGVYAVTLKDGDNVSKVMVDATTGNIS